MNSRQEYMKTYMMNTRKKKSLLDTSFSTNSADIRNDNVSLQTFL